MGKKSWRQINGNTTLKIEDITNNVMEKLVETADDKKFYCSNNQRKYEIFDYDRFRREIKDIVSICLLEKSTNIIVSDAKLYSEKKVCDLFLDNTISNYGAQKKLESDGVNNDEELNGYIYKAEMPFVKATIEDTINVALNKQQVTSFVR